MDEFTKAYVEAMLWTETDGEGATLGRSFSVQDIDSRSLERIKADCTAFQAQNQELISGLEGQAGHDFWLSRAETGSGFLSSWAEPAASTLHKAAKGFRMKHVYISDDNKLYVA